MRVSSKLLTVAALMSVLGTPPAIAASVPSAQCDDAAGALPTRFLTPGPFYGEWQVTVSDGTQLQINIAQKLGGITKIVTGSIDMPTHGSIRGFTASKTRVHLTFILSGVKGELDLEIGKDGQSFIGAGHLADGTPITWTGQMMQAGMSGDTQPAAPNPQSDAPSPDAAPAQTAPPQSPPADQPPAPPGQTGH